MINNRILSLIVLKTNAKITFFSLKTMLFEKKSLNLCILNNKN